MNLETVERFKSKAEIDAWYEEASVGLTRFLAALYHAATGESRISFSEDIIPDYIRIANVMLNRTKRQAYALVLEQEISEDELYSLKDIARRAGCE